MKESSGVVKPDIIGLAASIIVWGIKQFKKDSVKDVIKGTHLQNKESVEPYLLKEHKTDTGTDYVFSLAPGLTKNDFEKNRGAFEAYLNSTVEIEAKGRKLVLKTYTGEFPKEIKFNFDHREYPKMIMPFPVGVTPDGKLLVEDLVRLPHMMIGGATNHGKTSYLLGLLVAVLLSGAKVSIVDRKGVDFNVLAPWVNLALTDSQTEELLRQHVEEMHRRLKILRENHCQNHQEYAKNHNDLPYLVLMVDELTQVRNKKCHEYILDLAVLSRAVGISLVLATQKPSAKLWDGFSDVRSQLAGAVCFYVRDQTDSQIVLGSGNTRGADLPKIPGRAVFNNDNDVIVQAMYLSAKEAYSILSERVPKGAYSFEQCTIECKERVDT